MTCVVVGATAGLGRAIAEKLAKDGHSLFLIASDKQDLISQSEDLKIRFGVSVKFAALDLRKIDQKLLEKHFLEIETTIKQLFLIAGSYNREDNRVLADNEIDTLFNVNFIGPARILNFCLNNQRQPFKVKFASSIATIIPRKNSISYSSSKVAAERYLQSLYLAYSSHFKSMEIYRLGFIDTSMTIGTKTPLPKVKPEAVAKYMVQSSNSSLKTFYFPRYWWLLSVILKLVPLKIIRSLNF